MGMNIMENCLFYWRIWQLGRLFCEVIFTLFRLYFVYDRGFVPYVEWGSEHLYYEPDGVDGEHNVFLYYFEPVPEVTNVINASYVVEASYDHIHEL